jgi:hypothetical protein
MGSIIPKALHRLGASPVGLDEHGRFRSVPGDETSIRLVAEQRLVKQLGYQIIEEAARGIRCWLRLPG